MNSGLSPLLRRSNSHLVLPDLSVPSSTPLYRPRARSLDGQRPRLQPRAVQLLKMQSLGKLDPISAMSLPPAVTRDFEEFSFASLLELEVVEARGLLAMDTNILGMKTSSDPYCVVSIEGERWRAKTRVIATTLNPRWEEKYEIEMRYPDPIVKFELFDKDLARKDDFLGSAELDLSACKSGQKYEGWLRLSHPEYTTLGMLRVSAKMHVTDVSDILGYTRKNIKLNYPDPPPLPKFNINQLYGPWMLIMDVALFRTILPLVWKILDVLYWGNPNVSGILLFLWFPLCYYIQFWPTVLCLALAARMKRNQKFPKSMLQEIELLPEDPVTPSSPPSPGKKLPPPAQSSTASAAAVADSGGPTDKMTLGTFISQATTLMPGWLKTTLAGMQIPSRQNADILLYLYDLFHWRNSQSVFLFRGLILLGCVFFFFPFWLVIYFIGLFLLLLYSPALSFIFGCISHFRRRAHAAPRELQSEFNPELESEDSRRMNRKPRGTIAKLMRNLT